MPYPFRDGTVAGVVLAAGRSRRMGRDKRSIRVGGETLAGRAVRAAAEGGLAPVVVVVRSAHDAVAGGLPPAVRAVIAPDADLGPGASLARGLEAIGPDPSAAVVLLADMPFVDAGVVRSLVDRYRTGDATIVASSRGEAPGPPVVFDRAWFDRLARSPRGGREILRRHADAVDVLRWPGPVLLDVDRPADLSRAEGLAGGLADGGG